MAALEKVNRRPSFEQDKNLSGFVDAEKVRDRLLNTVVEYAEIIAAETSDKLSASIGDQDPDVDPVNTDANVVVRCDVLLKK